LVRSFFDSVGCLGKNGLLLIEGKNVFMLWWDYWSVLGYLVFFWSGCRGDGFLEVRYKILVYCWSVFQVVSCLVFGACLV